MNSFHVDHSRLLLHSLLPPSGSSPLPAAPTRALSRSISFSSFSRFHYMLNKQLIRVHKERDSSFFSPDTHFRSYRLVTHETDAALPPALINRIVVIRRSPTFVPVSAILKPQLAAETANEWNHVAHLRNCIPICRPRIVVSDDKRLLFCRNAAAWQTRSKSSSSFKRSVTSRKTKNAQDTSTLSKCRDFTPDIEYFVYEYTICDLSDSY